MIRHFNYTSRQKIDAQHFSVSITDGKGENPHSATIRFDLSELGFPQDGQIRVEAWKGHAVQRWLLGDVGDFPDETSLVRQLTDVPLTPQFRLTVVAGDNSGLLLGSGVVQPTMPRQALIALKENDDLGSEIWRVDFGTGSDTPELLINSRVDAASEIVRSDAAFRSLVMPQVLRNVLTHMIFVEGIDPDDDELGAWTGWIRLAQHLMPGEIPKHRGNDDNEEIHQWIGEVTARFAESSVQALSQYQRSQGKRR